ncbi:MAG TPA: PD-(D/E)XK nuclease family protein, partial [Thermoanaerobaculia bacterium]|nr:PD-(D/E)XK nuclease family protein [Thermoanaerobaculia bacterium]
MSFQPLLPFGPDDAEPARVRLIDELARVCREHPLEEKVLLAPSLSIGHQLTERLARAGNSWAHVRVETIRNLAHGLVGPALAQEGLTLLSRAQALALVEQACAEALGADSYFGQIKDRPGLHRALQSTFDELRAAGISAGALPARVFPDSRKAVELAAILNRYEQALRTGSFLDRPGVLRRALERARPADPSDGPWYLLPSHLELSSAERELVEKVSGLRLILLPSESPEQWRAAMTSTRLFRATGEENEVREVFRRLLTEETPLDEAEVLHTDPQTYPALIYELAEQYAIPCTFAGGIAVDFSRPGQAAVGFLAWIGGDFEEAELRSIVAAGAVDIPGGETEGTSLASVEAARILRAAAIGWGRQRHVTCLDRLITELEKPEDLRREQSWRDPEAARRRARREKTLAGAHAVRVFVKRTLSLIPQMESGQVELPTLARAAARLVAEFGRVASEFDGTGREALIRLFSELEALPAKPLPIAEATRRLIDAVRDLHVDSDRPRPGALHVADYRSGGYSGRRRTFILGLDDRRHPGSGLQDPVLLDEERRDINETVRPHALAIRGDRPTENTSALQACLARLSGEVAVGFSCWNLLQGSDQFPAPFFLEAYREITRHPTADYTELLESLPPPAGFLPDPADSLDETEWMLARLRDFPGGAAAASARAAYPWLADGKAARAERESDRFSAYDGMIGPVGDELDPRATLEPISASRIQTLARCPYAYFLHDVLGVAPPAELESDPRQWLDPMSLGSLLHDVFHRFFTEISARGEKPSVARHAGELEEIAEQFIGIWRERIPPRSAAAFALCRDAIAVACRTLLREEEEHCGQVTPRYFEVPFGLPRAGLDSGLASAEPVEIALGASRHFRLRGRIDRIDEAPDGTFHVWDYKTGSTGSVAEQRGLDGGRQAQYALYAAATEELLTRAGRPARVSRSGYFFPGQKGQGQRIEPGLDVGETRRVVNVLFDLLAAGAFPHTPKKEDCSFCDFRVVCGSV